MANKTSLVEKVIELSEVDLHKKEVTKLVDATLEAIIELTKEGKLQLAGFGNFEVRERAARKGRNPKTGEELDIAAKKAPAFKPGKVFKEAVI